MTVSSREFKHSIGRIKKACEDGIVIITYRGKPSHVLMTYADYIKLQKERGSLFDVAAEYSKSEVADVELFTPPRV